MLRPKREITTDIFWCYMAGTEAEEPELLIRHCQVSAHLNHQ